ESKLQKEMGNEVNMKLEEKTPSSNKDQRQNMETFSACKHQPRNETLTEA
ncbi:hypothetical protein ACJMK2_041233, partial [Sinanodonta woodiana]